MKHVWLKLTLVAILIGLVLTWVMLATKAEHNEVMSYKITTPLKNLSLDDIEERIWSYLEQGFWDVDLNGLHDALMSEPWVKQVRISRHWPNQIVLQLQEKTPIARWGEDALVDSQGVVFRPTNMSEFDHLVILIAHDLQTHEIIAHWREAETLLNEMNWSVNALTWYADDVLKINVAQGHVIYTVATNKIKHLQRFKMAWPKLTTASFSAKLNGNNLKNDTKWQIDLRYSNGMALNPLNNVD